MGAGRQSAGGGAVQSGIYAFLFTDVEGSTSKWEEHPEAMRAALARHDAILRERIAAHGGHVFSTAGDAFCAAFPTVPQALAAALACQSSLQQEPWPEPLTLAVRMAVHAGSAEARGGDYFGPSLNRTARILSAGHGGQVLLSDVAHDLSRDSLPAGVSLKALGEFRLKDLGHPEQVFQLCHDSIASEFPRLRTLESLPGNLPPQVTSFIGRERELEQAVALLEKSRLVTLTGTGGCGKTRLALHIAAECLERFPGGVWMVELAPLADPAGVVRAAADAMGIEERAGQSLEASVLERLATEPTLMVLDNCEHLLDACTALASSVLRSAPGSRVLATSREPLGVTGEATYRVPSLATPASDEAPPEEVESSEAARLFLDRVRLHQPEFAVHAGNARALASVCRRLDGIPLAIELAAARARSLSIEELDQRLDQCFRVLTGGSRSALPRQQTLRSLIDWSFNLLRENEKTLMTRLSVFSGGWSLQAAEAVCSGGEVEDWEVLDLLTSLVDKSLVTADTSGDTARYGMLETVRQYAAELLAASEGAEELRDRHLAYFSDWATAGQEAYFGPGESEWLDQLDLEHGNISKALSLGFGAEGHAEQEPDTPGVAAALRLAAACGAYWYQRSRFAEGLDWLQQAQVRDPGDDPAMSARSAFAKGSILVELGRAEEAAEDLQAALAGFQALGLKQDCARTLNSLGTACKNMSRYDEAREYYSEAHRLFVDAGDSAKALTPLVNLANMESERQNFAASQPVYAQLIEEGVRIGNAPLIAHVYSNLRYAALLQGDYDAVLAFNRQSEPPEGQSKSPRKSAFRTFYAGAAAVGRLIEEGPELAEEQAIAGARADLVSASAAFRKLGMLVQVADALGWLARLERFADRPADAWRAAVASLRASLQTKARHDLADSCDVLALVLADEGQPELAAKCLGASEVDREEMGVPRFPLMARQVEAVVGRLRSEMGDEAYEASHQAGRAAGVSAVAAEMAALLA